MKNRTNLFPLVMLFVFALACNENKDKASPTGASNNTEAVPAETTPEVISAVRLIADYEKDESTADKSYKGKTIIVTGEILEVSVKHDNTCIVLINSPESSLGSVRCMFAADQIAVTGQLIREQEIVVRGVCEGLDEVQVVLTGCKVDK